MYSPSRYVKQRGRTLTAAIIGLLILVPLTALAPAAQAVTPANPVEVAAKEGTKAILNPDYPGDLVLGTQWFAEPLPPGGVVNRETATLTVPGEGWWVKSTPGFIFEPEPGFIGDPTPVNYYATDESGGWSAPATLTVHYPHVDPVTAEGFYRHPVTAQPIVSAGTDPESVRLLDPSTKEPVADPVKVDGQGTWSVGTGGAITFTPAAGFLKNPTPILYTASVPGHPAATAVGAEVRVVFYDLPNLTEYGSQGEPTRLYVSQQYKYSSLHLIDPRTGMPLTGDLVVPNEGTWAINEASQSVEFTPVPSFADDATARYTVQLEDGSYIKAASMTVITPDISDITRAWRHDRTTVIPAVYDDQVWPGSIRVDELAEEGRWSADSIGNIRFTPNPGYRGPVAPVRYFADDGAGHTAAPATITLFESYVPGITVPDVPGAEVFPRIDDPAMDQTTIQLIDPATGERTNTIHATGEGVWRVDDSQGYAITFEPDPALEHAPTPVRYTMQSYDAVWAEPGTLRVSFAAN